MKKSITILLSLLLIFSMVIPLPIQVKSAGIEASGPKLRVLEIIATGSTSQLQSTLGTTNYEYTVMPMKKFVAEREELDGQYDVIAIMEGKYTSNPVSGTNHNTTSVMNDITNLKAKEIIDDFINKGQPVILYSSSISTGTKLNANFSKYLKTKPDNVILYKTKDNFKQDFNKFINSNAYKQIPRFSLTKPSTTKKYIPGEQLDFTINVRVPTDVSKRNLQAKLYIDSNFDDKYTTDEIVAEKSVTTASSNISFELPKGYSGVRYWKVELVDVANNLKSYEKGMVNFSGKTVELKVLQVQRNANDSSSLKLAKNMNQTYLTKTGEYNITIDVTDMATFNNSKHSTINGNYDMVVFGFADMYNNVDLTGTATTGAVGSLKKFIASGQSVMFTHDTIFKPAEAWVKYFTGASGEEGTTGQMLPITNLGYNAPNTSTTTKKVNSGLMTEYPYALADTITIANTHNQYYTLDLEDPDVIPWYNITGSNRDVNDSWNHYYTYSKKNITYSGTGHTSSGFPDTEQKLFVNTMHRAFVGSNHAPEITVHTPVDNQIIPSNQNIELSYTVQDYDIQDKKFSTKVFLNGEEVVTKDDQTNGSTINVSLDHKIPNGGTVVLKIQATDSKGAMSEKSVTVKVQKVEASLEVKRTVNAPDPMKVNTTSVITYTVTPKDITGEAAKAITGTQVTVSSLKVKETFPSGLEITADGTKTGTTETGITLEKTLNNVVYLKTGDVFKANPMTFTVQVKPTIKKQYLLNNSVLTYTDWTAKAENSPFNSISLNADIALTGLKFPNSFIVSRGTNKNFSLDLSFLPIDAGIKDIKWSEESGGTILTMNPTTGVAAVIAAGSTYVNVTVTDVFGTVKVARASVSVRIPVNDFTVSNLTLNVGETKELPITAVSPVDGKGSLEISLKDSTLATIDRNKFTITGITPGTTDLIVVGMNEDGTKTTKTATVTVNEVPVESIQATPTSIFLNKNEEFKNIVVEFFPANATNKKLIWESENSMIATVTQEGVIQAISTGTTRIKVSTPNGKYAYIEVKVGQPLTGLTGDVANLTKGDVVDIKGYYGYTPLDATDVNEKATTYESSNTYYVEVKDGKIIANRIGSSIIRVTVENENGTKFTTDIIVNVSIKEDKETESKDRY